MLTRNVTELRVHTLQKFSHLLLFSTLCESLVGLPANLLISASVELFVEMLDSHIRRTPVA